MARAYKAILRRDRVEWIDPPPKCDEATPVYITLVAEAAEMSASRGPAMAEALEALARTGGLPSVPDPVAWQRDIRQDRLLPERKT